MTTAMTRTLYKDLPDGAVFRFVGAIERVPYGKLWKKRHGSTIEEVKTGRQWQVGSIFSEVDAGFVDDGNDNEPPKDLAAEFGDYHAKLIDSQQPPEAATPRPWDLEEIPYETNDPAGGWYLHFGEDGDALYISKAHCSEANARLILCAVNAHEAYQSALETIRTWLISPDLSLETLDEMRRIVNEALRKV